MKEIGAMSASVDARVHYRKLWPSEVEQVRAHFQRLDQSSLHMRFGRAVSQAFLDDYCANMFGLSSVVFGAFVDGELRGVAELRMLFDSWPLEAELAFSVEQKWQDSGIGTDLMSRVLLAARNRGIAKLYMICLRENHRMRRIALKYQADLAFQPGDIVGHLDPPEPNQLSMLNEWLDDASGFMTYMLDLRHVPMSQSAAG